MFSPDVSFGGGTPGKDGDLRIARFLSLGSTPKNVFGQLTHLGVSFARGSPNEGGFL